MEPTTEYPIKRHSAHAENSPRQVPPVTFWLMWTLGNGLAAALLIPLAIALLTALQQPMANSNALYQVVQWVIIMVTSGLISLASAFVMRGFISRPGLWFLMTWAAWAVALVYPTTPLFFQYISNGNPSTSIQVYSQVTSILTAAIKFIVVGFAQWLVLRIDYRRAWTWLLWYTGGIAVSIAALLAAIYLAHLDTYLASLGNSSLYTWISNGATYLVGFAIAGAGLWGILHNPVTAEKDEESGLIVAEWAGAGLLYAVLLSALQATGLLTLLLSPFASNATLQRLFTYFWIGLALAISQWLVLRRWSNIAIAWGLVTLVGTILGRSAIYGLGNVIKPGTFLETIAQNPLAFSVIITLISSLVLSALQAIVLAWRNYERYWFWFTLQIVANLVAFLASYFINQVLGLAITGIITGLAIAIVLRSRSEEAWVVTPLGETSSTAQIDDDGEIIAQRFRQALGRRSAVTVFDDSMEIDPGMYTDRELTERLITGRGMAQVFAAAEPPAEDAPVPAGAQPVLYQDSIASASVGSPDDPEQVLLRLEPTDEGLSRVEEFRKANPGQALYLAVDERVVINQPLEVGEEDVLELRGLAPEEAATLAALLDNDPLSIGYQIEADEE